VDATVTVVATGYAPESIVHFYVYSTPRALGSAVADADGVATLVVTVPPDLPAGAHTVVSYGIDATGATRVLAQQITIAAPATAAAPSPAPASPAEEAQTALPRTGSSSAATVAFGVALMLAGAALETLARRRTTDAHS
jgi:LPXTG-motif cell wall-anchored protein